MPRRALTSSSVLASCLSTLPLEVARPIRASAISEASEPDAASDRKQAYGIFSPCTTVWRNTWPLHKRRQRAATARSTSGSHGGSSRPAAHTTPRISCSLNPTRISCLPLSVR
jgi:hypothetical protein